jgi:hypothetical protein
MEREIDARVPAREGLGRGEGEGGSGGTAHRAASIIANTRPITCERAQNEASTIIRRRVIKAMLLNGFST